MTLENVITGQHLTAITALIEKVIGGIINFFYSFISVLVGVITKPEVLASLAVIFIMFWAYRKFVAKVGSGVL